MGKALILVIEGLLFNNAMFQYGGDKKEQLLPSDAKTRAVVDQRMYFDMSVTKCGTVTSSHSWAS